MTQSSWFLCSWFGAVCRNISTIAVLSATSCAPSAAAIRSESADPVSAGAEATQSCGGAVMAVHFYNVGQALAVLVSLPDGRRILVDTGEQPDRAGCGEPCRRWSQHLLELLATDVPDRRLDMIWTTHQHSDHAGNAATILDTFQVSTYVDNGTNLHSRVIQAARVSAEKHGTRVAVVHPENTGVPLPSTPEVRLTSVVPEQWPADCHRHPNDCSIGLRLDYCRSSVVFVGDAEQREETVLDMSGPVTLLQVGHHGSDSSSSADFLARVSPHVAVVSAAEPGVGTNRTYCHPRRAAVERLSAVLGGATAPMRVFAGKKCWESSGDDWTDVAASRALFLTARDGDVTLATNGDGQFAITLK
jgi:competence protein ComEC